MVHVEELEVMMLVVVVVDAVTKDGEAELPFL